MHHFKLFCVDKKYFVVLKFKYEHENFCASTFWSDQPTYIAYKATTEL